MTVKELKEALSHYSDDAKVEVYVNDNTCECTYFQGYYDMWIEGNKDTNDLFFGRERNADSDVVRIGFYH